MAYNIAVKITAELPSAEGQTVTGHTEGYFDEGDYFLQPGERAHFIASASWEGVTFFGQMQNVRAHITWSNGPIG
jgi:hypothetical protein